MKSNVFKVFAVFITVVSVCMMGAALATFFVHPDLTSEMNTPAMLNFTFERTTGETPKWTVTRRFGDKGVVGSFDTPYQALIKAHQNLKTYLADQTGPLVTEKQADDVKTAAFRTSQEQDEAAVMARLKVLMEIVAPKLSKNLQQLSENLQALSVKSKAVREETADRRTDVVRLQHELEEARTDLFRLTTVRRDLTDRLVRLQIDNRGLQDRQSQLNREDVPPLKYDGKN